MSGLEAGAANWLAALWGGGSEGVHQQPHPLGHQIGVTFIRMPKNIFRFRRIAKILNSLPGHDPIMARSPVRWRREDRQVQGGRRIRILLANIRQGSVEIGDLLDECGLRGCVGRNLGEIGRERSLGVGEVTSDSVKTVGEGFFDCVGLGVGHLYIGAWGVSRGCELGVGGDARLPSRLRRGGT
jgi:hypothetical protein